MSPRNALLPAILAGCAPAIGGSDPRPAAGLVAVGDGVLAAWADEGASVAHVAGQRLGRPVRVDARRDARLDALAIPPGEGGWVVLSAGPADLAAECGCGGCWDTLDGLLTVDAHRGALVDLVDQAARSGRGVAVVSTPPRPEGSAPDARACNAHQATLAARAAALADERDGVVMVNARALGVAAPLTRDGAARLGAAVAGAIRRQEQAPTHHAPVAM